MVPELLPILTPSCAHLRLAVAHIIDWRDQRGRTLDLHQHDVVLDGGRAPPPIELDDLVKLRPFAKDCRRPFEAVALTQQAIDHVDLQDRVMAKVCDGTGRANIREHQMFIVPGSSGSLGGEIGGAVWADGGNEAQLLFVDHASHVVCQDAHRASLIAVSASAVRSEISRSIPQALPRRLYRPPGA